MDTAQLAAALAASCDLEDLPMDDWPGRLLFHGTSVSHAEDIASNGIRLDKCGHGYFGIGFYTTPDASYALSNYADWRDEEEAGAVVVLRLTTAARISDQRNAAGWAQLQATGLENRMSLPDLPQRMQQFGIDGLADRSFGGVVLYNPAAAEILGWLSASQARAALAGQPAVP